MPFFRRGRFFKTAQNRPKNGQNLKNTFKKIETTRNVFQFLVFALWSQNYSFQNVLKSGSAVFGVPWKAKNTHFWRFTVPQKEHFPISERFETNNFVIRAQKLRTGRCFVSFFLRVFQILAVVGPILGRFEKPAAPKKWHFRDSKIKSETTLKIYF